MAINRWPCIPDNFTSILPDDLPYFIQAGANNSVGRATSIIDSHQMRRIDAFDPFENFADFCKYLRRSYNNENRKNNFDDMCTKCDLLVAKKLTEVEDHQDKTEPKIFRYRCYMGLEEMAAIITIERKKFMLVSGQFLPPEGSKDIQVILAIIGRRGPLPVEISKQLNDSIVKYDLPEELWSSIKISEEEKIQLISFINSLEKANENFIKKFLYEAKRIQDIGQNYYKLAKAKVESDIVEKLNSELRKITQDEEKQTWIDVSSVLEVLKNELNLKYVAFFSSKDEIKDTILTLKAVTKDYKETITENLHFNWKKADLKISGEISYIGNKKEWTSINFIDSLLLLKGIKGTMNPFSDCICIIPNAITHGPYGIMIIGPNNENIDLTFYEQFLFSICHEVMYRLLTSQLSFKLREERADWERTSKLTGHRIRATMQNINSQLRTIEAVNLGKKGFTTEDRRLAEIDLEPAFQELREISYAAESNVKGALDVKSAGRKFDSIYLIIKSAIQSQEDLAEEFGVEIICNDAIQRLPNVWVNTTLMKQAFLNLINNGIKYSYEQHENNKRILLIETNVQPLWNKMIDIKIVNFGLGIKKEDLQTIFNWETRLHLGAPKFRDVYGKGIGLWEVKHIIEGHGGRIKADSVHHTKAPVNDRNINQCVTVFTTSLPIGRMI